MTRYAIGIAVVSCALATAIACADNDATESSGAPDASAPDGSPSDPSQFPHDAGADTSARDAAYDAADEPVTCAVTPCAIQLAAGYAHACVVLSDGTVRCWGLDLFGALGAGVNDAGEPNDAGTGPVQVDGISDAKQISTAGFTTCVRTTSGDVKCWGQNDQGQLGISVDPPTVDGNPHPAAAQVALTGTASRVDVGYGSVCANLDSGELACWGSNEKSQLLRPDGGAVGGPGTLKYGASPVHWTRTAFGNVTGYAISDDAQLMSWGVISGRDTTFPFDPEPRPLPPLANVVSVAAGPAILGIDIAWSHTCAIAGGDVYCWGKTFEGDAPAFCTGVPNDQRVPAIAPVRGTAFPQQVAVAQTRTCVRMTDGTVECCGDNARGQLGLGNVGDNRTVLSFTPASALTGYAVQVVTGGAMTCALLRDGKVQCWGGNESGELGQRSVDSIPHPTPLTVSF